MYVAEHAPELNLLSLRVLFDRRVGMKKWNGVDVTEDVECAVLGC